MKNLIAATCMAALMATQASATYTVKPEPPVEQPETSSNDDMGVLIALLGVVVAIAIARNSASEPDLSEPRPQVRPEGCLNKHGVIVTC